MDAESCCSSEISLSEICKTTPGAASDRGKDTDDEGVQCFGACQVGFLFCCYVVLLDQLEPFVSDLHVTYSAI